LDWFGLVVIAAVHFHETTGLWDCGTTGPGELSCKSL
jgi:hypothetical protein